MPILENIAACFFSDYEITHLKETIEIYEFSLKSTEAKNITKDALIDLISFDNDRDLLTCTVTIGNSNPIS